METIDGWEVDREKRVASRGMLHLSGPDAALDQISFHALSVDDIPQDLGIPASVARILLGDCPDCLAWQAGAEESAEIMHELVAGIAALTWTDLEHQDCSCGGHLSAEAHAQIKAAQSGWTGPGALPWRPAVGERCLYFMAGDWIQCERRENSPDDRDRFPETYAPTNAPSSRFYCDSTYSGIRPLGSLPVPSSVRVGAEGGAK